MNRSQWYETLKERVNTALLSRWVGQRLVRVGRGYAEVAFSIKRHHLQRRGQAHGGWYGFVSDTAGFFAVMSLCGPEDGATTVEYKINLLAAATLEGSPLTAKARVVKHGSSLAVTAMKVVDNRGRVVAAAIGTYRIFPARSHGSAKEDTNGGSRRGVPAGPDHRTPEPDPATPQGALVWPGRTRRQRQGP